MEQTEGWVEIEYENRLNSNIIEKVKVCNYCKHMKHRLFKSGRDPIYYDTCSAQTEISEIPFYTHLEVNSITGHIYPFGYDGEGCPFNKEILRDKKINNLIN